MSWWAERSPRERRLLAAMAVLAVVVLGWLLIVRPLSDALAAAKTRHAAAVLALGEARARAMPVRRVAAAPAGPVDAIVATSAREAGFATARVASQGPTRVTIVLDAARPQALFGWVARLEENGLVVERLTARTNSDRTLGAELAVRARDR